VAAPAGAFGSPSHWERELPDVRKEPVILSEEETAKVREDLFRMGEWKLSLPQGSAAATPEEAGR
jgi:hypothetical protein